MDLSQVFATINRDHHLANLRGYGFSTSALNLLYGYLKSRKQLPGITKQVHLLYIGKRHFMYMGKD